MAIKLSDAIKSKIAEIESDIELLASADLNIGKQDVLDAAQQASTDWKADWKALAMEAHDFLATVVSRHPGDAVYDFAQQFIAKVKAAL